jgi:DNA-binding MltR family transcriptional regulator
MNSMAEFLHEFQKETDRAAAVLGGAYLESRLEELLRSKFVGPSKLVDDLLRRQGALSSFSAKISIAYAVGLISKQAAEDLHVVRDIRNHFAHEPSGTSFKEIKVEKWVRKFNILKIIKGIPMSSSRLSFNLAVAALLLNSIETRIRQMPKIKEAEGVIEIRAESF